MTAPSLILHHYTSGNGLLGIFESSEIWATNIHQLNDAKEFAHAVQLGTSSIRSAASSLVVSRRAEIADAIVSRLESISRLAIYVVCFSEVGDSISQWRGYCPPGFGYSIGFDGERLRAIVAPQGFRLDRCIYDGPSQKQMVDAWAQRTLSGLSPPPGVGDDIGAYVTNKCGAFLQEFVAFAPFLKHYSFRDEREWRLVALVPSDDPRMRLRAGRSMLLAYLPVKLNLNRKDPLVWNVQVGPTPHAELAVNSVCHYFNKVLVKNGVGHSSIPYRDW